MTGPKTKTGKKGAALLVVLFIIMVITISSLGFLSRSDVELACGRNMALKIQMDYLAESGLEHARGLILNPQEISSEYWTGATAQQLVAGNDYYDVAVVRDDSDPTNRCNYIIDCNSYRLRNSEKIGRSNIRAELRLDPCIAFWSGNYTTVWSGVTINGDVYCNGTIINKGLINGDLFANALSGVITGRQKAVGDLSLVWPRVTVADFTSNYTTQTISSGSLSGQTLGPYDPVRVCYRNGDLTLAGNVQIEGMLIVNGNLTVQGVANTITAAKNLPAILVTGNLIIESNSDLNVNGLVVIDGTMRVSADAAIISILGGLFVNGGIFETTKDSSGNDNTGTLYNGPTWQPLGGWIDGALEFDGINDYVNVKDDFSLRPGDAGDGSWTISVWVKPPNIDQRGYIVSKRQGLNPYEQYGLAIAGPDSHSVPSGKKVVFSYIESANICERSGYTNEDIVDGDWHHIAAVANKTAGTLRIYVNGFEKAVTIDYSSGSWPTIDNTDDLQIGCERNFLHFNGLIDDVRIYNCVLDANDVGAGLVGHWRLDESGSSVTVTAAPAKTAILVWSAEGIEEKWGQAVGAFFKSIQRQ